MRRFDPDELELLRRLVRSLGRFSVGLTAIEDAILGSDHITNEHVLALVSLSRGPVTTRQLAAAATLSRQATNTFVKSLAKSGFATIGHARTDRRAVLVTLTGEGSSRLAGFERQLPEFVDSARPIAREIVAVSEQLSGAGVPRQRSCVVVDPLELVERISQLGVEIAQLHRSRSTDRVEGRQLLALILLVEGWAHRPTDLAVELELTSGGTTNLLDGLERRGLISRQYGRSSDRRVVVVEPTEAGRTVIGSFLEVLRDMAPSCAAVFADVAAFDRSAAE